MDGSIGSLILMAILAVCCIFGLIAFFVVISFINIWIQARMTGAPVSFLTLLSMRLRRVPIGLVVQSRITAVKAGIPLTTDQLEAHYLAGGDVNQVVRALIAAEKANLNLGFNQAAAIDLATHQSGKSVFEAVMTSVNPKVIDCPNPASGKQTIAAVAKDGIQLQVKARVTVRTHLDRFVGGATEETIIARVGEGIVTAIGSANSYKDVLENPDTISKRVLEKGLDASTAFGIMSIDIADVDVGDNIGARLQQEQAEANKQMAIANAETRRAIAVANEQEMKARTQEMRAKVVEAEAQIPMAMAEAFRSGRLGVMDYYRMQNIQSDTRMRQSIAGEDVSKSGTAS
ncbi:MAG TPA: flotillin-like protein FloA [Verrucomicrobiae bacterium]|nr:flotillin-like protein FloA [Verrucomicrobiae bacterium]